MCLKWSLVSAGGVLLPCGVSVPDGGGGDAHPTGSGEGGAGEVPAVPRRLPRHEEGKGRKGLKFSASSETRLVCVVL